MLHAWLFDMSIRCAALFDVTNARSEGFKWCCPAISSSFRQ